MPEPNRYHWTNPDDPEPGEWRGTSLPLDMKVKDVVAEWDEPDGTTSGRLGPEFEAAHNAKVDAYMKAQSKPKTMKEAVSKSINVPKK